MTPVKNMLNHARLNPSYPSEVLHASTRFLVTLTILTLVLAMACGPTAETPEPTQGPPDVKPTFTPKPPPPEPPTPKPIEPTKPIPTPTAQPGDIPPPTEVPMSLPTPDPSTANQIEPDPPHPDGLEGCKTLNLWSDSTEMLRYQPWCWQTLIDTIIATCKGIGETPEEVQCADEQIQGYASYNLRMAFTTCAPITRRDDYKECYDGIIRTINTHDTAFHSLWNEVTAAADGDSRVKTTYHGMSDCVREAGYEPLPSNSLIPWQQLDADKIDTKAYRSQDPAQRELRLRAMNQCALETKFYQVQDDVWREVLGRIASENPERLISFKEEGIIEILDEPGPAPFLTIQ